MRASTSLAPCMTSVNAPPPATMRGGLPPSGFRSGDVGVPPTSATDAMPVSPASSSPALVSVRTGVALAIEISATTLRGSSVSSRTTLTSPTRMPLNSTALPGRSPDTEPS